MKFSLSVINSIAMTGLRYFAHHSCLFSPSLSHLASMSYIMLLN